MRKWVFLKMDLVISLTCRDKDGFPITTHHAFVGYVNVAPLARVVGLQMLAYAGYTTRARGVATYNTHKQQW